MPSATHRQPLLTPAELAAYLGLNVNTLRNWRTRREGPKYQKLANGRIRYRWVDVQAWLDEQTMVN
jgi:predicted DNA-binding transcriptional regulator AlpA